MLFVSRAVKSKLKFQRKEESGFIEKVKTSDLAFTMASGSRLPITLLHPSRISLDREVISRQRDHVFEGCFTEINKLGLHPARV